MRIFPAFFRGVSLLLVSTPLLANECFDACFNEEPACSSFHVGAEWLYWKVNQDNLRAGSFVDDFPDPVLKIAKSTIIEPKFKFNNGVRCHAGYVCCHTQWEFNVIYTYIPLHSDSDFKETIPLDQQTETHRQFIIPNSGGFPSFGAFGNSSGLTAFSSMLVKWGGDLSYLDLDLARKISFNSFHIKPHIGCRVAWMKQQINMDGALIFVSTNDSTFGRLMLKEKLTAVGIEGGFWGDWQLGRGFTLVGHVGGSLLYSWMDFRITSHSSLGEEGPVVFIIDSKAKARIGVPSFDYFLGLTYEAECYFPFSLHVGWEQRLFFDVNQMALNRGHLNLQGLALGGCVRF